MWYKKDIKYYLKVKFWGVFGLLCLNCKHRKRWKQGSWATGKNVCGACADRYLGFD